MSFKDEIKSVKGVGEATAENILEKFTSWKEILESAPEDIMEVSGVGEKTAELILGKAKENEEEREEERELVGKIMSYRGGSSSQMNDELIIAVDVDYPSQLIGRKVIYETSSGKTIGGSLVSTHGKNKKLLARFEKSLPGQALGTKVEIK